MPTPTDIRLPFTQASAAAEVRAAEDAWNTRDPVRVSLAYTEDSVWRNRDEFFTGRSAIRSFLKRKSEWELDYRLMKDLWTYGENRIDVRFPCEWHDAGSRWYRARGNELWEFGDAGFMRRREASINDRPIATGDRKFHGPAPSPRRHDPRFGLAVE